MLSAGALMHLHGAQNLLEESVVWGLVYSLSHQDKCLIVLQEEGGLLALLQFSHCPLCFQLKKFSALCLLLSSTIFLVIFFTTVVFCHFESGSVCNKTYLIWTFLKMVFQRYFNMCQNSTFITLFIILGEIGGAKETFPISCWWKNHGGRKSGDFS